MSQYLCNERFGSGHRRSGGVAVTQGTRITTGLTVLTGIDEAEAFLHEREARDALRIGQVDLIGELGTTSDELDRLGSALSRIIQCYEPGPGTRRITRRYPIALAEFLVATGVHDYRQGDYWSHVIARTGLPRQNYPGEWGTAFERTVDRYGLETFPYFDLEGATRYVSRILAHGGIPNHSLADFFGRLLVPAAVRGMAAERSPEELIQSWQANPSVFFGVDEPVRRFLIYGGPAAHDFLGRCLDMAVASTRTAGTPGADELGLPERVVERFATWRTEMRNQTRIASTAQPRRVVKPSLIYDPWAGDAFVVELPEEPLGDKGERVVWTIGAPPWARRVDVTPARAGRGTRHAELRAPSPFKVLEITIGAGDEHVRTWRFAGLTDARPLLAFRPHDGHVIEWRDALPATDVFVVAPREATLSATAHGCPRELPVIETLPLLSGDWGAYQGVHLDLAGCDRLDVTIDGRSVAIPIRHDSAIDRPRLDGAPQPRLLSPDDPRQLWTGRPPRLLLPLPMRNNARIGLDRWRVAIRSLSGARPVIDQTCSPATLQDTGEDHGSVAVVDLAAASLLGPHPFGEFEVVARGPLGRDARFFLAMIPRLAVTGHETLLVPDGEGPPAARLLVRVDGAIETNDDPDDGIEIQRLGAGEYRIVAAGHHDRVPLTISSGQGRGEFGVVVPLRRLKWAVAGLGDQEARFTDEPVRLSRDEVEQSDEAALVLDVPSDSTELRVSLVLEDLHGRCLHRFADRPGGGRRRFSLRELSDTLRERPESSLRLSASVESLGPVSSRRQTVVAILSKSLRVEELAATDRLEGAVRHVEMTWREDHPLTNRVLRLWPHWRLWEVPRELSVPDDAAGRFEFQIARALLPGGDYRAELAVVDPWVSVPLSTMPELAAGNCADVTLGTREERAEYLEDLPATSLGALERFLAERDPRHLHRLEKLDDDEIPAVLRAVLGLVAVDDADALHDESALAAAMTVLRATLSDRPEMFSSLADMSGFDAKLDHRLRRFVVELGLLHAPSASLPTVGVPPAKREALWRLWAPLLCVLDGEAIVMEEPVSLQAASDILGRVVAHRTPDSAPGANDSAERPSARRPASRFSGREVLFDVAQLRHMREALRLLPSGILGDGSWTLANFEWLIRLKQDSRAEAQVAHWIDACRYAARDDLDALRLLGLGDVTALIEERWPSADHGPLSFLPYVVGATALTERALAHGAFARSALMAESTRGTHSPRMAFAAAVELYTHDLCLMDLLLLVR